MRGEVSAWRRGGYTGVTPTTREVLAYWQSEKRAARSGWAPVVLDIGVDATSPAGELVANVMVSVAQWERRAIGQRTKEALAVAKASGVALGRPRQLPTSTRKRIARMRGRGMTLQAIADKLNFEGVPTAQGGAKWWPGTVRKVLNS